MIEVLRDAGLQAGDAATLTVDAEERSVRLDWTPLPSRPNAPVAAPGERRRHDAILHPASAALLCLGADIAFGGSEPPPTLAALLETEAPESASER